MFTGVGSRRTVAHETPCSPCPGGREGPCRDNAARGRRTARDSATQRANAIWKQILADYQPPPIDPAIDEALEAFIARRKAEGGAAA